MQEGFFDHLLRSHESYAQKWEYIRQNPVRAGLVKFAEDCPAKARSFLSTAREWSRGAHPHARRTRVCG